MENERDFFPTTRVLILHHNDILREGLRSFIEAQPHIRLAGSVPEADTITDVFKDVQPALTLVDLNLPFGRGVEVIRRIREIDPEAWVIGLVTYEWDERVEEAISAGAATVLPKDLIAEKLVPLIRAGPPSPQLPAPEPVKISRLRRWRTYVRAFLQPDSTF